MKTIIMHRTAVAAMKENKELVKTFNEWSNEGRVMQVNNEYYVWQQQ